MSEQDAAIGTFTAEKRHFEPSSVFARDAAHPLARRIRAAVSRKSRRSGHLLEARDQGPGVPKARGRSLLEWKLPHSKWFVGAELNVSESCLDRHLDDRRPRTSARSSGKASPARRAPSLTPSSTNRSSSSRPRCAGSGSRRATASRSTWAWCPRSRSAMLACARIGAPHTVVFGGFAAESLRDRINDCQAQARDHAGRRLAARQRGAAQGDGRPGGREHARASRRCSCSRGSAPSTPRSR